MIEITVKSDERDISCCRREKRAERRVRWITALRYFIAFIVGFHGLVYVRIGAVLPGPIKEWRGRSWLLGSAVTDTPLKMLVVGLHVIAGLAILACAVTIGFAPSFPGFWRPLAIGGATVGIAAFAAF